MMKVKVMGRLMAVVLILCLSTTQFLGQVASSIELSGTSATLNATYNAETIVDPNLV